MMKNKYKNKKTAIDNILFDSAAEAEYYIYLKMLQNFGDISDLKMQVTFPLNITDEKGKTHKIAKYIADFTYLDKEGQLKVDDVKNPVLAKGSTFRIKAKLFKALYGADINIISPKRRKT